MRVRPGGLISGEAKTAATGTAKVYPDTLTIDLSFCRALTCVNQLRTVRCRTERRSFRPGERLHRCRLLTSPDSVALERSNALPRTALRDHAGHEHAPTVQI